MCVAFFLVAPPPSSLFVAVRGRVDGRRDALAPTPSSPPLPRAARWRNEGPVRAWCLKKAWDQCANLLLSPGSTGRVWRVATSMPKRAPAMWHFCSQ